jgi:hypothetical protein
MTFKTDGTSQIPLSPISNQNIQRINATVVTCTPVALNATWYSNKYNNLSGSFSVSGEMLTL